MGWQTICILSSNREANRLRNTYNNDFDANCLIIHYFVTLIHLFSDDLRAIQIVIIAVCDGEIETFDNGICRI